MIKKKTLKEVIVLKIRRVVTGVGEGGVVIGTKAFWGIAGLPGSTA